MPETNYSLQNLVKAVQSSKKYAQLSQSLVKRIAAEELPKHRDLKTAVKTTRTRLHRLAGAFIQSGGGYAQWLESYAAFSDFDPDGKNEQLKLLMRRHASTNERLPFLEIFYQQTLASLSPVRSVLDLACGLNPLAIPFMPLHPQFQYWACDVLVPEIDLIQQWFQLEQIDAKAFLCDLLNDIPRNQVQLALALKTLPILDQIDPGFSTSLLKQLQCEHILISYPTKSLGGRSKGMVQTYSEHFSKLTKPFSFNIQRFDFSNEIAFLLSR